MNPIDLVDSCSILNSEKHVRTRRHTIAKRRLAVVALMSLAFGLPGFGKTYKSTYPVPCSELWGAVKDTLSNPENYSVEQSDDTQMTAAYKVKHAAHVTITGAALQRTNHVTLVSKGTECEMHVVSNYSGFEHDDKGDFRKRVDESLAKLKSAPASPVAEPAAPVK
jgi:hypothetical protein